MGTTLLTTPRPSAQTVVNAVAARRFAGLRELSQSTFPFGHLGLS
jgi:hypothetical protein